MEELYLLPLNDIDSRVDVLLSRYYDKFDSELCLKNLNQLASIDLIEMDEDCFLLRPTGYNCTALSYTCNPMISEFRVCSRDTVGWIKCKDMLSLVAVSR